MPALPVTLLDVILLLVLFGFVMFGFMTGLIHALGALIGVVAGTAVASRVFVPLADKYSYFFAGNENVAKIVIFILVFVIVNRLVGLLFSSLPRSIFSQF